MSNVKALTTILSALEGMDGDEQKRILQSALTFLGHSVSSASTHTQETHSQGAHYSTHPVSFSEDRSMSAKDFLREKRPSTDLERVACLAYYLTHYRETQYFKTIDISALNTEAAQPKFSSTSVAVENATKAGLLAQAVKGQKQLSAGGEVFVQALPDRDAAKAAISGVHKKRKSKNNSKKKKADNK